MSLGPKATHKAKFFSKSSLFNSVFFLFFSLLVPYFWINCCEKKSIFHSVCLESNMMPVYLPCLRFPVCLLLVQTPYFWSVQPISSLPLDSLFFQMVMRLLFTVATWDFPKTKCHRSWQFISFFHNYCYPSCLWCFPMRSINFGRHFHMIFHNTFNISCCVESFHALFVCRTIMIIFLKFINHFLFRYQSKNSNTKLSRDREDILI